MSAPATCPRCHATARPVTRLLFSARNCPMDECPLEPLAAKAEEQIKTARLVVAALDAYDTTSEGN